MGAELLFGEMKKMEMDKGDGCTILWIYLIPLTHTLENGYNGKFYGMYVLPQ